MKQLARLPFVMLILSILVACTVGGPQPTQTMSGPTSTLQPSETAAPTATLEPTPTAAPTATAVAAQPPMPAAAVGMWWNDTIFYEIFVRSFKDSNGDGVGDINGLIEKLDYLNDGDPTTTNDLGITGIWLMPITESSSYHGYDVVDYYAVDQEYGTKEDFKRLVDEAHQRGIRVIMDLVLNHTGVDHPWFKESDAGNPAYRDWYIWVDQKPSYIGPWGEQVWNPGKNGYYYAVFWSGMPDLNLENPEVMAEIYKISDFWLEEMNVDGFRMDAIKHFVEDGAVQENTPDTHAWLQAFHQHYKSIDPQTFVVGEAWTKTSEVVDYIGDEVDIAFEFDLAQAFIKAAKGPSASPVSTQLNTVLSNYPQGQYGVFLTNHDQERAMTTLQDVGKARLAATMLLTSPGVPFIYYGEEIGMKGAKPDENIRRPMQWSAEDPRVGFSTVTPWREPSADYPVYNVSTETDDPDSLLSYYRTLIGLRNAHAALRTGDTRVLGAGSQSLYAVLRYDAEEVFLILVNVGSQPLASGQYSLTLKDGPFTGPVTALSVVGQMDPAAPTINADGGFSDYVPFQEIPAGSAVIIQFKVTSQ